MKRGTPLKRSPFKPKPRKEGPFVEKPERPLIPASLKPLRMGVYGGTTSCQPVAKSKPVRSEAYRRIVAAMPCAICGIEGYSQAAHPNASKGMATKASDVLCFALCGPRPGEVGCHARFDQSGYMTKDERRAFEKLAASLTQKLIVARGLWPANLPSITGEVTKP